MRVDTGVGLAHAIKCLVAYRVCARRYDFSSNKSACVGYVLTNLKIMIIKQCIGALID